jgi:hypothetical protein
VRPVDYLDDRRFSSTAGSFAQRIDDDIAYASNA